MKTELNLKNMYIKTIKTIKTIKMFTQADKPVLDEAAYKNRVAQNQAFYQMQKVIYFLPISVLVHNILSFCLF